MKRDIRTTELANEKGNLTPTDKKSDGVILNEKKTDITTKSDGATKPNSSTKTNVKTDGATIFDGASKVNAKLDEKSDGTTKATIEVRNKVSVLEGFSFVWTLLSVLYSTFFAFYSILRQWGNRNYTYILLGIIALYIVVFVTIISIVAARRKKKTELSLIELGADKVKTKEQQKLIDKQSKKTRKMLADYKSGIQILKALTNVIYIAMTVTLVLNAATIRDFSSFFAWLSVIVSLVLAVLSLTFKISVLVLKKGVLPYIAKRGKYTCYQVINGRVMESTRKNKFLEKLSEKYRRED